MNSRYIKSPSSSASLIVALIMVGLSVLFFALVNVFVSASPGRIAVLTDGDGHIHKYMLDVNTRESIETLLGHNLITVENGQIKVIEASCDGQDCLHQGAIDKKGQTIVCLPNKLIITIEGDSDEHKQFDTVLS